MRFNLRTLLILFIVATPALSWDIRNRIELPKPAPASTPPSELDPLPNGYPLQPEYDGESQGVLAAPDPASFAVSSQPEELPVAEWPIAHVTHYAIWVVAVMALIVAWLCWKVILSTFGRVQGKPTATTAPPPPD
jgi:hypothetical protein